MMLIMGQSNRIWHYWSGRYPGSVGVLIGPSYGKKVPIDKWMPFVLDNDAFTCWRDKKPWQQEEWLKMISMVRLTRLKPIWAAVPDVVADKNATIESWERHHETIKRIGWPTAFVVQDGMVESDVPKAADVVFVGGTDGWKFRNLERWTKSFPRVHCARVNSPKMILRCEELGCESIDGTGWFREPSRPDKLPFIESFIEGFRPSQDEFVFMEKEVEG